MNADAAALLSGLGLDIHPQATLGTLNTARQQMVAIARGVSLGAKILVLDEPTSSLSDREVTILHGLIRRLRQQGTAIVYISHRFDELYDVCDRVTILRDGRLVATRPFEGLERIELVCLMLGKSREALQEGMTAFAGHGTSTDQANDGPVLLRAEALTNGARLRGVTFDVRRGQVAGLAGLLGSGSTKPARVLFGAAARATGTLLVAEVPFSPHTPRDAIRAGIGFVSEDRQAEGIIPDLSVRENLTLAALPLLTRYGVVSRRPQAEIGARDMRRLGSK